MSPVSCVAELTTGSPLRKLVLMVVAALDGRPTAAQVAAAAERPPATCTTTLDDLVRAGTLSCAGGAYTLPPPDGEESGWEYSRLDEDTAPAGRPAWLPPGIDLYPCGHHGALLTGGRRPGLV